MAKFSSLARWLAILLTILSCSEDTTAQPDSDRFWSSQQAAEIFDKTLPVTVRDFLAMTTQRRPVFVGVARAQRAAIDAALERVGLAEKGAYKLGSLSGGERQRVLFAQATLPEPALLVLDEPMTGLDTEGHEIVERAIRKFAEGGGTVLWINHDILQVYEVADNLTYIDQTVLLDGAPREALKSEAAARLYPSLGQLDDRGAQSA